MTHLLVDGLVKRYDRVAVIEDASFEARPGELTLVLGPSGSGKSTLARLIAGLERPDSGEIFLDGRMAHSLPPQERGVGFVQQEDALWPHLTVAENAAFPLRVRGVDRRERRRRVVELLGTLGIESLADRRPADLSGLQSRRAALARALATEPGVLLVDDPLGSLEARVRQDFRDDLRRLHAEGDRTTVVFMNDAREALALADRLAIMDLGRFVQTGPPRDVYERPHDAFVAQLLGPSNLVQGQVDGPDGTSGLAVKTPLGRLVGRPASPAQAMGPGAPVTVSIRPESVALVSNGTPNPTANRLSATLERQVFHGETCVLSLRGPGDWPLSALALRSTLPELREGQIVSVTIPIEQVIVLQGRYASTA